MAGGGRPRRRCRTADRIKRFGPPLLALGGIAGIAAAAWILAGGDPSSVWPWTTHSAAADVVNPAGGVPLHLDSVLPGADALVDGIGRGQTPLVALLVPGQHVLTLRHPDTLEVGQTLNVPDSGASAVVRLWGHERAP